MRLIFAKICGIYRQNRLLHTYTHLHLFIENGSEMCGLAQSNNNYHLTIYMLI